ncbi:hypothetical protein [Novosphingobium sp. TH158]|uniref:hypothetical protein n=1 Tax=Novosphingobium sp. TH158 TaxID=2067455 RepID=UPI00118188E7|nr:hypothetical protein [Novosphingobium sp. TH158]
MKGETTVEAEAGKIEAKLLSGLAVKNAAKRIVDEIGTDYTNLTFVVLPLPKDETASSDYVGGAGWDVLPNLESLPKLNDMLQLREDLDGFKMRYASIVAAGTKACKPALQSEAIDKSITGSLGSATSVLNAATPLLDLFKQDFTYGGHSLRIRDGMLVSAIRGEIAKRRKPLAPSAASGGARTFAAAMQMLERELSALPTAARCAEDSGAEQLRKELADEFARFRADLSWPGSEEGLTVLEAAEKQLRQFGPRPATLVLSIDASGATTVKKKNLFTMFGAESLTVSSGVVVSYEFYEPRSGGVRSLRAGGVLSCMSGAVGFRAIHKGRKVTSQATCY